MTLPKHDAPDALERLQELIGLAQRHGAEAADAVLIEGRALSCAWRLGALEGLERSEGAEAGLRVIIGKKQALAASSDLSPEALEALAQRVVAMARAVPDDPYCGLAEPALLAAASESLDLDDADEPTPDALMRRAAEAEDAARSVRGITNSEGAEASYGRAHIALATSTGFARAYTRSSSSLSVAVVAGEGTAMERDYDYTSAVFGTDLDPPAAVGRRAGERAVKRLHPRKARSLQVPVVYDPRVAGGLLGHLAAAINGAAIARGTSFLKDALGGAVFARGVRVIDDPLRRRGLRSRPFDGEGVASRSRALIDDGRLTGWLLDCRSSRQLGLATTASAARGAASLPAPAATNLYMTAGAQTPAALMADIRTGFYVTELIGMGVNPVTGDYSRGAAGFWIENGEIAHPVSEVTIAGNLRAMFAHLTPADDLRFRYGIDAPTVRIEGMTVGGA